MMREIDAAVLDARMDRAVHVIVLRGAGEKFFCAGANIGMLKDADPEFKYYFCLHANETLNRLEQTPKLVIAALNGHTSAADSRWRWRPTSGSRGKDGGQDRAAGSGARRPAGHRRHAAAGAARRQGARDRVDGGRAPAFVRRGEGRSASSTTCGTARLDGRRSQEYAKQFTPPHKASKAVGRIKRAVQSGLEMSLATASRSSASCSSCCSSPTTREKESPRT
jgi:enoyl-CoA hydratase/carnithine racemase